MISSTKVTENNFVEIRTKTREDIQEYVKEALESNAVVPMLKKLKIDQTSKIQKLALANKTKSEIITNQVHLGRRKKHLENLEFQLTSQFNPDFSKLQTLQKKFDSSVLKLDSVRMETDTLEHIFNRTKLSLIYRKKPAHKISKDLATLKNTIESIKQETQKVLKEKANYDAKNDKIFKTFSSKNKNFTNDCKEYMKEYKQLVFSKTVQSQIQTINLKAVEKEQQKLLNNTKIKKEIKNLKIEENRSKVKENITKLTNYQVRFLKILKR